MRGVLIVAALAAACGGTGYVAGDMQHRLSTTTPADLRTIADVTMGLVRAVGYATARSAEQSMKQANLTALINVGSLPEILEGHDLTAVGHCAGASDIHSSDLLIGDYAARPTGSEPFVNFANKVCWWRDSGERVACPKPEPECVEKDK